MLFLTLKIMVCGDSYYLSQVYMVSIYLEHAKDAAPSLDRRGRDGMEWNGMELFFDHTTYYILLVILFQVLTHSNAFHACDVM
jgi:hypothetical protein